MDVCTLEAFYHGRQGVHLAESLSAILRPLWQQKGPMLAYGYGVPYLENSAIAAIPASLRPIRWPRFLNRTLLVDSSSWPFTSNIWDRILMVHALEFSEYPQDVLNEAWRTLKPQGQLILVIPNILGYALNRTPFGCVRSQAFSQWLIGLYKSDFVVGRKTGAFLWPLQQNFGNLRPYADFLESWTQIHIPWACSLLLISATKKMLSPVFPEQQLALKLT